MKQVLIPRYSGVFCSFGMIVSDVRHDHLKAFTANTDKFDLAAVNEVLADLEKKAVDEMVEEGYPEGETGGASLMVEEGVLKNPDVDAIFGLHISSGLHVGKIEYKPGGAMASSQRFVIDVIGKQSHGSSPWMGVDPIVVSAQIINGLQKKMPFQLKLIHSTLD